MSRCLLKLEEHDTGHRDISRVRKIERDVERGRASFGRCHPVFLVFSVRDLAWSHCLVGLDLEKSSADGRSNEVALELGDLGSNLIDCRSPLGADGLVTGTHLLLLLLAHVLLDFSRLGEVGSRDGESHIPVGSPLVTRQAEVRIFFLKHFIAAILKDDWCIVTLEGVEDLLVLGVTGHLVDDIVEVEGLLTIGEILLQELTQGLLDDWVNGVHVHLYFFFYLIKICLRIIAAI